MKKFLMSLALLMIIAVQTYADTTLIARRQVSLDGMDYEVEYEYGMTWFTVPSTNPPGKPHYGATITVYLLYNGTKYIIGKPFGGIYVEGGCFEDDPYLYVEKARDMINEPEETKDRAFPLYTGYLTWNFENVTLIRTGDVSVTPTSLGYYSLNNSTSLCGQAISFDGIDITIHNCGNCH